jgi:hypothetical protein
VAKNKKKTGSYTKNCMGFCGGITVSCILEAMNPELLKDTKQQIKYLSNKPTV